MESFFASLITNQMNELAHMLQLQRFCCVQEKQTQAEVEQFLLRQNLSFEREKRLSKKDIPDFLVQTPAGNIVLEVKLQHPKRQIYRQLERYAQHKEVDGILLLTGTAMGLPALIEGKPAAVVSLGVGWL